MASKGMTANPVKPARYRPGKAAPEQSSSDEDEQSAEEDQTPSAPPPKASSYPSGATKVAADLKKVDLNQRRQQAAAYEAARVEAERVAKAAEDEGFVTEESDDDEEEEQDSDAASESEEEPRSKESSSEDEAPKLLRPTYIKKTQRKDSGATETRKNEDELWAEEETRRKERADAMIQEQLERDAAARAAGKKDWDDDELEDVEHIDDTDGLDPDTERAAWKLRELKRVKREREAIEVAEKEREEIERRRNLSQEEREAEDKEFLGAQKEERDGKGKMSYMQKYFHKGAFFQDDEAAEGLANRDIMGSRYADDVTNRELLPQYMQIRDMTQLGRKGRTKYKDLKSEDTGKWGVDAGRGPRRDGLDERFQPDRDRGTERSGANAAPLGERKRALEGAPDGPGGDSSRGGGDKYKSNDEDRRERDSGGIRRNPSYSRSRSSPRRQRSFSKSPPRKKERRRSHSYSRSPSPPRHRYPNEGGRRRRSPSPYDGRHGSEKRRRVHAV